jgi:hypothetical protein
MGLVGDLGGGSTFAYTPDGFHLVGLNFCNGGALQRMIGFLEIYPDFKPEEIIAGVLSGDPDNEIYRLYKYKYMFDGDYDKSLYPEDWEGWESWVK